MHKRWWNGLVLGAMAFALGGCLPKKVVIDLAPGDGRLTESAVLSDVGGRSASKVAMIDITGLITQASTPGLLGSSGNAVDNLATRLEKAEKDPSVRAVILRINSPGGSVAASEMMYREVRGFRERSGKPVVASFAEVAASGGYYTALAADRIVAQSTSVTASIGVIIQTFNFSKGMSMIGVEGRAIVSRPNKDLANPFEPPVESQYAVLQGMVDEFYAGFVRLVMERRAGLANAAETMRTTATDGRVVTGVQALELGLVDELGGVREAFSAAKKLAGVETARLVKYHAEGDDPPRSPYALANASPRAGLGMSGGERSEVNLVQLNLGDTPMPGAGFYYLWLP